MAVQRHPRPPLRPVGTSLRGGATPGAQVPNTKEPRAARADSPRAGLREGGPAGTEARSRGHPGRPPREAWTFHSSCRDNQDARGGVGERGTCRLPCSPTPGPRPAAAPEGRCVHLSVQARRVVPESYAEPPRRCRLQTPADPPWHLHQPRPGPLILPQGESPLLQPGTRRGRQGRGSRGAGPAETSAATLGSAEGTAPGQLSAAHSCCCPTQVGACTESKGRSLGPR